MEIELLIDDGKYPIYVKPILSSEGKLYYYSEYLGATISTFPARKEFKGSSIEESLQAIAIELRKAILELLAQ